MNDFLHIFNILKKITADFWLKAFGACSLGIFSFFFDSLNFHAMLALFFLIVVDFFFGITSAYKAGEEIQSRKVLRTAFKFVVYFSLVSAGHLAETATYNIIPIDEGIIATLAITELISILESFAKMGYKTPLRLLNRLKELQ